jgi:hypothetical protein
MANSYETGSTITLKAIFSDISGVLTNTDELPIVTIYDKNFRVVSSNLISEHESLGTYKLIYSIPTGSEQSAYYYEFKSTLAGIVSLNRNKFFVKFCR